jgi:hypothetical protein
MTTAPWWGPQSGRAIVRPWQQTSRRGGGFSRCLSREGVR